MVRVAGVCFRQAGKVYYFDPNNFELSCGESVVVETARGQEFGTVRGCIKDVADSEIVAPLKKIMRIATNIDKDKHKENLNRKEKAIAQCQEKIKKHKLEMKLIDVEYTFDNSKIIFYFTADGRIDFRELVKDLAVIFRMRIELRQIGVRDEAKILGGMGICGRSLCCHAWLPDFEPVSIRMAKIQNLSLNPTKISGACGRLMCCLKYENDTYKELKKEMPDVGAHIKVKNGAAIVIESNILKNIVKARMVLAEKKEDGSGKLSSEVYTFEKSEFKVTQSKNKKTKKDEESEKFSEESLPEEIKKLLKE